MIRLANYKISAISLALIFVLCQPEGAGAFRLTDTIYTIPEDRIELYFNDEAHDIGNYYRRDEFGIGFGVLPRFSLWMNFNYLHRGVFDSSEDTLGDSSLRLWYYLGDFFNDALHCGVSLKFNLATGPDAYYSDRWSTMAVGRDEMSLGFAGKLDLLKNYFLHFSLLYTFREGLDESFYGGFHFNPTEYKTYTSLLGLNPFDGDSFLYYGRLKNDYITLAGGVNTDALYPFIFCSEASWSVRPYRGPIETDDIPLEGAGVDPLLVSLGGRYFLSPKIYCGLYWVFNPIPQKDFTDMIFGFELSVEI